MFLKSSLKITPAIQGCVKTPLWAGELYGYRTTVSIEVSKTFDLGSNPSTRAVSINCQFLIYNVNKVSNYFKESYHELLEKVSWPTWTQLQQSTVIVLAATVFITAIVALMDVASSYLLKLIYSFL